MLRLLACVIAFTLGLDHLMPDWSRSSKSKRVEVREETHPYAFLDPFDGLLGANPDFDPLRAEKFEEAYTRDRASIRARGPSPYDEDIQFMAPEDQSEFSSAISALLAGEPAYFGNDAGEPASARRGGAVMAKDNQAGPGIGDPTKQRITPNGTVLPADAPMSGDEFFVFMWGRMAETQGYKAIPPHLRAKHNLPSHIFPEK